MATTKRCAENRKWKVKYTKLISVARLVVLVLSEEGQEPW